MSDYILRVLIRFHVMMEHEREHVLFLLSPGVSFTYMQDHHGDEHTAVDLKLYSHRWRRWLPQKQPHTDSNRASQEQEPEPEPDAPPETLSAEDTDNSSHIEVGQISSLEHN